MGKDFFKYQKPQLAVQIIQFLITSKMKKSSLKHISLLSNNTRKKSDKSNSISIRGRFSHHEKGEILRKSLDKSRNSHNILTLSHKRFNDYGMSLKPTIKSICYDKNERNSNRLSRPIKQASQIKHEKNRREYISRKTYRRNNQHHLQGKRKRIETQGETQDQFKNPIMQEIQFRSNQEQKHIYNYTEPSTEVSSKNASQKIKILEKSVGQYYQMYMNAETVIKNISAKARDEQKKNQRIKQLYKKRVQTLARNSEAVRKNNIGHIYSYKQFPKDFIPDTVIAEYSNEFSNLEDSSTINPLDTNMNGSSISQLSLISH